MCSSCRIGGELFCDDSKRARRRNICLFCLFKVHGQQQQHRPFPDNIVGSNRIDKLSQSTSSPALTLLNIANWSLSSCNALQICSAEQQVCFSVCQMYTASSLCLYLSRTRQHLLIIILTSIIASSPGNFNFELTEAAGTKIVSRDVPTPVSTLALVSKAGSRYQWLPGLAEGLEKFAFRVLYSRISFNESFRRHEKLTVIA